MEEREGGGGVKQKLIWILFALGCLLQWAAPLLQISGYEKVLAEGAVVSFRCQAPDPYDMLRGRFLAVRAMPDSFEVPKDSPLGGGETVYAVIEPDKDGLATIKSLEAVQPASGVYVKVQCVSVYGQSARIEWPFDRFYLNEKIAPKADEWYRQNVRKPDAVIAEVRVLNGKAVLVDLKLEGRSFRKILEEMEAGKPAAEVK